MNRYALTQLLSIISCSSAFLWWWIFPDVNIYANEIVSMMLGILQAVIIPNTFFGLISAIILLSKAQLRKMMGCFLRSILMLWGAVSVTLMLIWLFIAKDSTTQMLPTMSSHAMQVTIIVPLVMLSAIVIGYLVSSVHRLHFIQPYINSCQKYVSTVFEYIFLLIPVLVFFVILKFLSVADFSTSSMALDYFVLAIIFVSVINFIILPCLFHFVIGVAFSDYTKLVAPVFFMTFLAGDSIAAIPLIARAADQEGDTNYHLSRIITLVVICFPWIGELANLLFPVYSAALEGYGIGDIATILSVGPFFMFTDPYISIPTLLQVLGFPERYQVTYLTLALLTDHMFEVCEALAVLFVVIRLKKTLTKAQIQAVSSTL